MIASTTIARPASRPSGTLTELRARTIGAPREEVLFEMVRYANRLLMDDVVTRLRRANSNWERLKAIFEGNFPEEHYVANTANAWSSFYATAASNERYAMLQQLFYRRLRSNQASALANVLSAAQLDHFTIGVAALIDGLWLRRGRSDDLTASEAIRLLVEYAEKMLGPEVVEKLQRPGPIGP